MHTEHIAECAHAHTLHTRTRCTLRRAGRTCPSAKLLQNRRLHFHTELEQNTSASDNNHCLPLEAHSVFLTNTPLCTESFRLPFYHILENIRNNSVIHDAGGSVTHTASGASQSGVFSSYDWKQIHVTHKITGSATWFSIKTTAVERGCSPHRHRDTSRGRPENQSSSSHTHTHTHKHAHTHTHTHTHTLTHSQMRNKPHGTNLCLRKQILSSVDIRGNLVKSSREV